jgi:hypothetical protein
MRLSLLLPLCAFAACTYSKEYIPVDPRPAGLRVPTEQKLVATAVAQAVSQASEQLKLSQYAGKSGQVEVNGVFPATQHELLDYVAAQFEGEMAHSGMAVVARPQYPDQVTSLTVPARPCDEKDVKKPDVRLVASLDWGGIDYTDKKTVNGGKVVGMIVVGILTFGIGAVIWALADSPTDHTLVLDSRVRMTVRAIPGAPGVAPAIAGGEGSARIVIDPTSDSGHTSGLVVQPIH